MTRKQPKPRGYLGRPKRPKWIEPGSGPISGPPKERLDTLGRDYCIDFNRHEPEDHEKTEEGGASAERDLGTLPPGSDAPGKDRGL